ncbi:MAG: type IV-A pilus assembly ATPase PilB [Xanthomonadales bacterium]|nr:type IV-A pilus assembly ATPase PilB [Xanthomonadales bacterium]
MVAAVQTMMGLRGLARRLAVDGVMEEKAALAAQDEAAKHRVPLHRYLASKNLADPLAVAHSAATEFGLPLIDVGGVDLKHAPFDAVDAKLIEKHKAMPLMKRGNVLYIAISDPTDVRAVDDFAFQTNLTIAPVLAIEGQLERAIETAFDQRQANLPDLDPDGDSGLEGVSVGTDRDESESSAVATGDEDAPIVKFVNKVLLDAIRRGASDIHFEPYEGNYRVRYRLDGVLRPVAAPPAKMSPRISSRLKVMSGLDIAEKRVPQDGRIKLNISKTKSIDFRVSTCPTLFGEKVVLRILDPAAARMGIDKLGYEDFQKELFVEAINKPYGMVLVTGPTGSGKTVSLYTALNILNTDGRNISTVEDPVEIRVPGINQVAVNEKRGMTFSVALRSFLRQDPDVIMVGEIRDIETAEIAIKAAQTGHMVLSTLHTNDAPQTLARLAVMGIAPYNIVSAVNLVIAQRLARRLHDCRKQVQVPKEALMREGFTEQELASNPPLFEAVGCDQCNEGYKGRTGIYQVMPMYESIQKVILEGGNTLAIAKAAIEAGIPDLRQSARKKAIDGVTSLTEINRVTIE